MVALPSVNHTTPSIPDAPTSIRKGSSLAALLDANAVAFLARNLAITDASFDVDKFAHFALTGLEALSLIQRARHIADALHQSLPYQFAGNVELLLKTLTPPHTSTDNLGLSGFFYLPHGAYIAAYGLSEDFNDGNDPFDVAMMAQYEITQRFSAEFSIRYFLNAHPARTLATLHQWIDDDNPHVRRLCSEGTRPRLPWGIKLHEFDRDPSPILPILTHLKDDSELYVRRSVANNLGDIAKAHPERVFALCESWVDDADKELKWLIRHAVRYYAKKGHPRALAIRQQAK